MCIRDRCGVKYEDTKLIASANYQVVADAKYIKYCPILNNTALQSSIAHVNIQILYMQISYIPLQVLQYS